MFRIYPMHCIIFINRPGVAGAVLQSPLLLSHSLIHWVILSFQIFKTLSILNRKSWGAEVLWQCSPPTMCDMSHVKCQMSGIIFFGQGVGFSRLRVWYQRGLRRLVCLSIRLNLSDILSSSSHMTIKSLELNFFALFWIPMHLTGASSMHADQHLPMKQ